MPLNPSITTTILSQKEGWALRYNFPDYHKKSQLEYDPSFQTSSLRQMTLETKQKIGYLRQREMK